jgi:transposase InsO family protein
MGRGVNACVQQTAQRGCCAAVSSGYALARTAPRRRRRPRSARIGVKTLYIEPGSPWENGYIESLNGKLQDELLKRELFYTLKEARVLIERWRQEYNHVRPHSSLAHRSPAPAAMLAGPGSATLRRPVASTTCG